MIIALAALLAADRPATPARPPMPDRPLAALLSPDDYPVGAIRREASGIVGYRLDIGADGAPTRCTVVLSADPDLDKTTCDIFMARAHFQPGRDNRGRAVASSVTGRVRWALPEGVGGPARSVRFAPFVVRVTFALAPGQKVSACSVATEGGPDGHWLDDPCGNLSASFLSAIGLDAQAQGRGTVLLRLETNGTAASPDNAPGRLVSRTRVRFAVNTDGSMADCETDDRSGGPITLPLCTAAFPRSPTPFEAAGEAAAPRHGRLGMSAYLAD